MKLRTSFFNSSVFKKDITRFAPAWGLYLTLMLVVLAGVFLNESNAYYNARGFAEILPVMAFVNLIYAFVNAQLLFGDLFTARLCNALHAMPLRRECWYVTHLSSGMLFSLIPNLVTGILALAALPLDKGAIVILWWYLASALQYLCFFGISVFCHMLTGNRFAALMVYGIVNFFSLLVMWLVDSLYEPLLYGIRISQDPFRYFCPVGWMESELDLINVLSVQIRDEDGNFMSHLITGVTLSDGWLMLAVYAVLGIVLLGAGMVLYRKRKLECAGDFSAFPVTDPVLLLGYTLAVGAFLHLVAEAFGSGMERYFFLAAGLVVGFFTGLMLLKRSTRVFNRKNLVRFLIFAAVFAATLAVTWADPLGVTRWVPQESEVVSVTLSSRSDYTGYGQGKMTVTKPEEILDLISIHEDAVLSYDGSLFTEPGYYRHVNFCVEYMMEDGSVRTRFYEIDTESEAGQLLKRYYSSFAYVTGYTEDQIPEIAEAVVSIYAPDLRNNTDFVTENIDPEKAEQMLRAIAADCAAGNMAQFGVYHSSFDGESTRYGDKTYLEFGVWEKADNIKGMTTLYKYMNIYEDCVHILAWMEANGLYDPDAIRG